MAAGLVVDPTTFDKRGNGPVWGTIFFQFEQIYFPASGWSDILIPITTEWLAILTRIASGMSGTHKLYFMDGPYLIRACRIDKNSVSLDLVDDHPNTVTTRVSADFSVLFENGITVGNQVEKECHARAWRDRDTASLSNSLRRARMAQHHLR